MTLSSKYQPQSLQTFEQKQDVGGAQKSGPILIPDVSLHAVTTFLL